MTEIEININPQVNEVFERYPAHVKPRMQELRELILETANESEWITEIEETLKWGEPSYITKIGSTIRMDWKEKQPETFSLYFKCTSRLVDTFKTHFENHFTIIGTRELQFKLDEKLPKNELKLCIRAALHYHKVKKLPTLGI